MLAERDLGRGNEGSNWGIGYGNDKEEMYVRDTAQSPRHAHTIQVFRMRISLFLKQSKVFLK